MARFNPSCRCSVWQISSTLALTVSDCLRRSRSSSRKPPADRRLKNATPISHASTSQGRVSSDGERRENPAADLTTIFCEALGCAAASGELVDDAPPEDVSTKNV